MPGRHLGVEKPKAYYGAFKNFMEKSVLLQKKNYAGISK